MQFRLRRLEEGAKVQQEWQFDKSLDNLGMLRCRNVLFLKVENQPRSINPSNRIKTVVRLIDECSGGKSLTTILHSRLLYQCADLFT